MNVFREKLKAWEFSLKPNRAIMTNDLAMEVKRDQTNLQKEGLATA